MSKSAKDIEVVDDTTADEAAEHLRSEIARCRADIEQCQAEVDARKDEWKAERQESPCFQALAAAKETLASKTAELLQLTNDLRRDYPLFQ